MILMSNRFFLLSLPLYRVRRRSRSSIVALGDDDSLKPGLPVDDYQEEFKMYNMISANQDNGKEFAMVGCCDKF